MKNKLIKLFKRIPIRPLLLVLLLLVLAVSAYLVTKPDDKNSSNKNNPNGSTANLSGKNRSNLIEAANENIVLTNKALDAYVDGSKDAAVKKKAVYDNASKLGEAIKALYNDAAQSTFNKYWKVCIDKSFAYAAASKKGDEQAKSDATNAASRECVVPLSEYIHKINPAVTEITIQSGLGAGFQSVSSMTDHHVAGNLAAERAELEQNKQFVKAVFGVMTDGVSKNKPFDERRTHKKY